MKRQNRNPRQNRSRHRLPKTQNPSAVAVEDTEPEPAAPSVEDDLDEVYDEPQPRNVRRRPFTSRLLRS